MKKRILTLSILIAMTLTASATDFITDVMLLGNKNQNTFNSQLSDLTAAGWIDINYDLNAGCGSGSDYIHLLYRKQSSLGNTGVPITDFYIRTGNNPPNSLTHEGRTYYLVPCNGSESFTNSQGDLNNNAGGAYIHLYYTRDALTNNHGVTGITFNTTQNGAVGENGGSTGYDLNSGCGSNSAYIYMHVATTAGANVVTLSSGSGEVQLRNGHILTGTGGADTQVIILDGATVTLNGVNITAISNDENHQWPGIWCLGDAVIVLSGGTTNTVKGGYYSSGIYVPANKTLTIQGNGTLNVTGAQSAAGIGGVAGFYSPSSCGNITINGGTVNATGGDYAAGIGTGDSDSCGNITINGGTVNATGGEYGAGIGSGYQSSCGSITISGGTVNATSGGFAAAGIGSGYDLSSCGNITITQSVTRVTVTKDPNCDNAIGAGYNSTCGTVTIGTVVTGFITQSPFTTFPYTVAFNANGGTGTMASMPFMYNVAQNLTANAFTNGGLHFLGWATSANGPEVYTDGQSVSNLTQTAGATVTLYAKWTNTVTLTQETGEVLLQDGNTLIGTGGPNTRVKIADGATVTFSGVNITAITNDSGHKWPSIDCLGNAVIVLGEGTTNTVTGGYHSSGLYVPENKTLTIQGSGTLNASGGGNSAGIGGGYYQSCGNITISGGTVNATGGEYGASIGGGYNSSCSSITISGGTVNATGGYAAAGIGSGSFFSSCGSITINGGTVTATGGNYGAGVGSGNNQSSCGNITISGGTVTATGGYEAAGIGSGEDQSSCGNISITQSVTRVTATKGNSCDNAIGAGYNSTCGTVTIGTVETGFITQSPFITFPYTVAFNANGGTGTMASMPFMYNVAQNLTANAFTNGGLHFLGWATSANGPEVYTDGQSVSNLTQTAGATVTLYAKWTNTVTLTQETGEVLLQDGNTLIGTGGPNTRVKIADGATVTFIGVDITAIANDENYEWPGIDCLGNAVIVLGEGTTNTVNGGYESSGIYMPANKTLTIQGSGTLNANGGSLTAGIGGKDRSSCGNIIISGGTITATGGYAAAGIGSGYNQSDCGSITINGGTVTATGGYFAAGIGSGYYQSSCGNITIDGGTVTATGSYGAAGIGSGYYQSSCGNITISGGTVTATGGDYGAGIGSGRNYSDCGSISITQVVTRVTATKGSSCDNAIGAGYNSSCQSVTIGTVETGFITQSPFTTFPYRVTFNANGGTGSMANMDFMYNVAQNLVYNLFTCTGYTWDGWATTLNGPKVYDEHQSVTNLTNTPHTVKLYARWNALKAIAGYGTGSGWALIASPVVNDNTPTASNGFLTAAYDLYRFNQDADLEWENWKQTGNHYHFNLESGRGYLYASQANTTLVFNGTPYSGNGQVTLAKTADAQFEGWNLIGNPFGTAKTIGSKPFYRMNDLGTEIIAATNPTVAAMEGIFVVANTNGETVTFAEPSKDGESEERIIINLCTTAAIIDRAIIRLGEGETLPKLQIREGSTKIYLPQGGKEYAIACAETTGEIPVNFKASENGTYTLTVNVEGLELGYLHLIDNLTGNDIDLLRPNVLIAGEDPQSPTSSYTFEAKTTDYASRFKLVFSTICEDADVDNETFAYIDASGNVIITADACDASLQVIDMTGRVVVTRGGRIQCVPTSGMTPGVYVLRLINGDDVKTQKIVVR